MAQRTLVDIISFNQSELHVAFEVDDGNTYVKIGGLDSAALSYIRLFTDDDRLGFMQRGVNIAHVGIGNTWDETENRLLIDRQPAGLAFGQSYRVWSTREKPSTGTGTGLPGLDGRSPILAIATDGERRVLEIIGYTIGGGITVTPITPSDFIFTWRDADLIQEIIEGAADEVTEIVDWEQGVPEISNFNRAAISLMFYPSADATDPILSTDPEWLIGIDDDDSDPQSLSSVVRLGAFVDNGDGTGTVEVIFKALLLDIMMQNNIYIELQVLQPNT